MQDVFCCSASLSGKDDVDQKLESDESQASPPFQPLNRITAQSLPVKRHARGEMCIPLSPPDLCVHLLVTPPFYL